MWQKRRTRHMKVDSATFGDPTRHLRRFWMSEVRTCLCVLLGFDGLASCPKEIKILQAANSI